MNDNQMQKEQTTRQSQLNKNQKSLAFDSDIPRGVSLAISGSIRTPDEATTTFQQTTEGSNLNHTIYNKVEMNLQSVAGAVTSPHLTERSSHLQEQRARPIISSDGTQKSLVITLTKSTNRQAIIPVNRKPTLTNRIETAARQANQIIKTASKTSKKQ